MDAGFKNVELIPIYDREYFKTKEDIVALLLKTPILSDFSEENKDDNFIKNYTDIQKLDEYIKNNITKKGILLRRRYYGIEAYK